MCPFSELAIRLREAEENLAGHRLWERTLSPVQDKGKNFRSVIYEMWCETCTSRKVDKIRKEGGEDEEKIKKEIEKMRVHKYIRETARSTFERAIEHQMAYQTLSSTSLMLKGG